MLTATFVTLHHVDFGEIADTCDLNIVLSANKMNAFEGSVWNDASPPPALRAPRNFFLFRVTNVANSRRCPQTKIVGVIHPHSLALRTLGRSGAAGVRARLADFGLLRELIVPKCEVFAIRNDSTDRAFSYMYPVSHI